MHDAREEKEYFGTSSTYVIEENETSENTMEIASDHDRFSSHGNAKTYLKVELAELLLSVNVGVSRHNYGTGGERHLCIWRLAVIRSDGGQTAIVSELLVQNGRMT